MSTAYSREASTTGLMPSAKPQYRSGAAAFVATIVRQQDWALLPLFIACLAGIYVLDHHAIPVVRPVYIYDSTISFHYIGKDNGMPLSEALLVPFFIFVGCALVAELGLYRARYGFAAAFASACHFVGSCLVAASVVALLTELFKTLCGRLRPDFLDRCQPRLNANEDYFTPRFGATATNISCTNTDGAEVIDGMKSFPSGHSSVSMALGWYGAFYLLWVLHGRGASSRTLHPDTCAARSDGKLGHLGRRLAAELASLLLFLVLLFLLAWPWGVGVTRFTDNRHNASDVVGGFFLALTFTPAFVLRAVAQHRYWAQQAVLDGGAGTSNSTPDAHLPVADAV